MKYFIIFYRCIFFYTLITIIYRIMGKREIGELSIMDFIVSIFITDMVVKQRYNIDDLLSQLREASVKSIDEVDYAVLETNGKLSIFLSQDDKKKTYPLPLILDGKVEEETLKQIRKTRYWLDKELIKQKIRLEDIFYCFYRNKKLYIIEKNKI